MERAAVLELVKRHGWNATSFQVLEPEFRHHLDTANDACVAYFETPGAWVAAGPPLADASGLAPAAARFVEAARSRGKRACFFAVERRFVASSGLEAVLVGEQPVWDPRAWDASLRDSRSLREQVRRARAKGVRVRRAASEEIADPASPTRAAVQRLVDAWLRGKSMAPMGFLVDVEVFALPGERRYFVAEKDGALVGVLVAVPVYARAGWLFEDLLRDAGAPNGTIELLVDAAMRATAAEGSAYVTLGLAPLTGEVRPWLRAARALGRMLYDFHGVRAFKAKLRPTCWEPIYLAYPRGSSGTVALLDVLSAFARGSFVRFGWETLLRGPAIVVRALALLLLPWTAALALAGPRWFPAPWTRAAWIGFDLALAGAMLALSIRWRRGLAAWVAAAIVADAIVTAIQALAFNVPRARGALEWTGIAVACLAPAFAAVVMTGAIGHRSRPQRS